MSGVIRREEFLTSALDLGTLTLDLADYATTGLRVVTVGPSGIGKTNAGLLIAEQLAAQGWICVLMDPEGEIAALYPRTLTAEIRHGAGTITEDALDEALRGRLSPFLVVPVSNAAEFVTYARVVLRVVDEERRPVFLMVDEGQMFSASRKRKESIGEASDLVNDLVERGRKRALDLFFTAHRYSNSLHRSVFTNKNLTFVGRQEDPTAWSALAPQFRSSKIGYGELAALAPGEFFCFSRRGVEKVTMPMAAALKAVAMQATRPKPALPTTFAEWDRAMREIPTDRLRALTPEVVSVLNAVAALTPRQLFAGGRALRDELEARA